MTDNKEHLSIVICEDSQTIYWIVPLAMLVCASPRIREHAHASKILAMNVLMTPCAGGHVDSGKSTTTGRLLFELGGKTLDRTKCRRIPCRSEHRLFFVRASGIACQ